MAARRKGAKKAAKKSAKKSAKTSAKKTVKKKASPAKARAARPAKPARKSAARRPAPKPAKAKSKVKAKVAAKPKIVVKAKAVAKPKPKAAPKVAAKPAAKPATKVGRFVWFDLMSTDVPRSLAFYTNLFGWTVKSMDMGAMGPYQMFAAGGVDFGGVVPFDQKDGRSHWMPYVSVANIDAACKATESNGGVVCVPPFKIPGVGRFAVVADPAGAVSSPMQMDQAPRTDPDAPPAPGTPVWNELVTPVPDQVGGFYTKLYGWKIGTMDMGPGGTYYLFKDGAKDVAGMMKTPANAPPEARPQWLAYIGVADVDATLAKAEAAGARVGMEPFDVPNVGRMAVFADPTGAMLALFKPSM